MAVTRPHGHWLGFCSEILGSVSNFNPSMSYIHLVRRCYKILNIKFMKQEFRQRLCCATQIYIVGELWNIVQGQIWLLLSCHPEVPVYTNYHHCSHYSSWEMILNIRVIVRVDTDDDGLLDEWTEKWTRPLYHTMLKAGPTVNFLCLCLWP